jgi:hypothetical protein
LLYRWSGVKVVTMSDRHDPPDPADSVMSTGVTGAPGWIEQAQGLRFPLAFIYGLSVAGAIGFLTPLPAVIAVVLAVQAVRRRVPHAYVALGVALIATAIGTWLMFANPFMSSRGDDL